MEHTLLELATNELTKQESLALVAQLSGRGLATMMASRRSGPPATNSQMKWRGLHFHRPCDNYNPFNDNSFNYNDSSNTLTTSTYSTSTTFTSFTSYLYLTTTTCTTTTTNENIFFCKNE